MEVDEENLSPDPKDLKNEDLVVKVLEEEQACAKKFVTIEDSRTKKIGLRPSIDGAIIKEADSYLDRRRDSEMVDIPDDLSPTVKLTRYEAHPPFMNGLDPVSMQLITMQAGENNYIDEVIEVPKMTREMRNLQTSTNESKILTSYLSQDTSLRSRKTKEVQIEEELKIEDEEEEEEDDDKDESLKDSQDGIESDTTVVLPVMEPPEKRRKSVSRSRTQSRALSIIKQSRKKSIKRQLNDEMSFTSDKDDDANDDDDDDQSEMSFITSRSLEGRSVNPPPKVSSRVIFIKNIFQEKITNVLEKLVFFIFLFTIIICHHHYQANDDYVAFLKMFMNDVT